MNDYFESIAQHYIAVIKNSKEFKINQAVRCMNQELLEPKFRAKIDKLCDIMENEKGIRVVRQETFRTNGLQLYYYNVGKSKIKTNGMHHYGIAQDLLCCDKNNSVIEDGGANEYTVLRDTAVELGLFVIGRWDAGHIQGIDVADQNALRNFVNNYRAKKYTILQYGSEHPLVSHLKSALKEMGFYNVDAVVGITAGEATVVDNPGSKPALPSIELTDFFGDETDRALRAFQAHYHLKEDGVAGEEVYTKLAELGHNITL